MPSSSRCCCARVPRDATRSSLHAISSLASAALRRCCARAGGAIAAVPGFGPAQAATFAAATELARRSLTEQARERDALVSPQAVRDYLRLTLAARPCEVFVGLFLDSQNRLLAAEELFRGTLAQTSVYPREVVKAALARNAAAMIFAHNHPSGVAEPSRADELLTQALKQALALVDIRTLDHFVVAGGHHVVRGTRAPMNSAALPFPTRRDPCAHCSLLDRVERSAGHGSMTGSRRYLDSPLVPEVYYNVAYKTVSS